jgi:RNA polymerase sigma-70 factor (ECF subfamily)
MLGSFDEAEEVVQETLLRAWLRGATLERDEWFRAWLYKIATNACLDAIKRARRRPPSASSFNEIPWLQPYPDRLLDEAAAADPAAAVIGRETIELTFIAMMQTLPPRQRAVLVLRELLGWPASDVAELLDMGVAAVNSALQRARATLHERLPGAQREDWRVPELTREERVALEAFIEAHERGDSEAALELIADDVRVTMPPRPYLFEGRDAVRELIERSGSPELGDWLLVATRANRQPAAASYLRAPGESNFKAFKLDVLRVVDGAIAEVTTFGERVFDSFDLPRTL